MIRFTNPLMICHLTVTRKLVSDQGRKKKDQIIWNTKVISYRELTQKKHEDQGKDEDHNADGNQDEEERL